GGDLIATNHAPTVHDSGAQQPKPHALEALPLTPPMNHAIGLCSLTSPKLSFLTSRGDPITELSLVELQNILTLELLNRRSEHRKATENVVLGMIFNSKLELSSR